MSLISPAFYAMTCIAVLCYYLVPRRFQYMVLLAASVSFFCLAGNPYTIVYLVVAALTTWAAGKAIGTYGEQGDGNNARAKRVLIISLLVLFGMLGALKYSNFVLRNAGAVYGLFTKQSVSWRVNWPQALGISYYTLQLAGYLADCYWGICRPDTNFGRIALFASFYPQMVSGPISKYAELGEELNKPHAYDAENIREGLIRIAVGLFKKIGLADNLSSVIPFFFETTRNNIAPLPLIAMFGYVVQVYADFSGCMDIISGTAHLFGIQMTPNFNSPFISQSIQEFWQRWHITLGRWMKEYVMYPLLRTRLFLHMAKHLKKTCGKMMSKKIPTYLAMFVLWACMGIWHGGTINWMIESLWFWMMIVVGDIIETIFRYNKLKQANNNIMVIFRRFRTTVIYAIGTTFFYFSSIQDSFSALRRAFSPTWFADVSAIRETVFDFMNVEGEVMATGQLISILIAMILFFINSRIEYKHDGLAKRIKNWPIPCQIMLIATLMYVLIFIGAYGPGYHSSEFLYGGF